MVAKSSVSGATLRAGTYPNNALRGPGLLQVDLSFAKNFELPHTIKLQIRADLFNAFNRVTYTSIATNIEARNFGQLTGAAGARAVQLNTQLSFSGSGRTRS